MMISSQTGMHAGHAPPPRLPSQPSRSRGAGEDSTNTGEEPSRPAPNGASRTTTELSDAERREVQALRATDAKVRSPITEISRSTATIEVTIDGQARAQ